MSVVRGKGYTCKRCGKWHASSSAFKAHTTGHAVLGLVRRPRVWAASTRQWWWLNEDMPGEPRGWFGVGSVVGCGS